MQNLSSLTVSRVADALNTRTENTDLAAVIADIKNGRGIGSTIAEIRKGYAANLPQGKQVAKSAISSLKRGLPAVTFSGQFSARRADALVQHSGLIVADLDELGDNLERVAGLARTDDHAVSGFRSPSGDGFKIIYRCDPSDHAAAFRAMRHHVRARYGIEPDASGKDVARLCFLSHDPDVWEDHDAIELPAAPVDAAPVEAVPVEPVPIVDELDARYGPLLLLGQTKKGEHVSGFNGQRVAADFATENKLVYPPELRRFYAYNESNGTWETQTEHAIRLAIGGQLIASVSPLAGAYPDAINAALRLRTDSWATGVANQLRAIVEESGAFETRSTGKIHVANGVLDLATNTLEAFSHELRSRNQSPVAYDPAATCPVFLQRLLGDALAADDITLVQAYAGQCLIGRNPAQRLLLLRGRAGGGKSTFVSVIERIVGAKNVSEVRTEHLAERFETFRYLDKSLLTGKDVPADFLDTAGAHVLKKLCGGDLLETERKGSTESVQLRGDFNVIITSNSRLRVRLEGDTDAWRRRLLIVDYSLPPAGKPIPDFDQWLLQNEGSGILNWCIEGARRLMASGYRFDLTPTQQARVDSLLEESDSIRAFVRSCMSQSAGDDCTIAEIHEAYVGFCDTRGWQPVPSRKLEHAVPDIVMEIHRAAKSNSVPRHGKGQRGFRNVRVEIPETADEPYAT